MNQHDYDPNHPAFSQALTSVRPLLDALPADRLETIRHDIVDALCLVLGVAPRFAALRPAVLAQFGEAAAAHIDRLEPAARACGKAHAEHLVTLHGADVEEMVGQLDKKRAILGLEAESLVSRKLLPGSVLAELVGGTGYKNLCLDVLQLVSVFRAHTAEITGHTAVTSGELDQAEALANALATTLGANEQASSTSSPSADLRRRAYTHFVRTYDECRRLVAYFRWQTDDADEIAPSLSAGRTAKKRTEPEGAPVVLPSNGLPIAPGMPGAPVVAPPAR